MMEQLVRDWSVSIAVAVTIVNVVVFALSYWLLKTVTAISSWWEQECARMEMECTKRNW